MNKSKLLIVSLAAMLILAGCGANDSSKDGGDVKVQERPAETVATTTTTVPETTTTTVSQTEQTTVTETPDSSEADEKKEDFIIPVDEIPVTKSSSEDDIRDEETNNWGVVSKDGNGTTGFTYNTESNSFRTLRLSELTRGNVSEWTDAEKMNYTDRSKGFTFYGTPYITFDYKDEKNGDLTPVPQEDKDTAIYIETDFDDNGEEIVTGFAYSIEHANLKKPVGFGNKNVKTTGWTKKYSDFFILGDTKEKVEGLIGKGYEHDNYAFYSTEEGEGEDMMKTYTIIEYSEDDTVQKVIILARDLIK